ncbi:hypothetical protein EVAR_83446_1 [Eumeta japonica]|uniref:Uncharacterized protein n=1 Tax=Eumeta variegata TaxID=151549 RepID=A0A4C1TYH8_EUMVA|nr:hypothetical protein EVAR_83446_1 [Eumeta japonica]
MAGMVRKLIHMAGMVLKLMHMTGMVYGNFILGCCNTLCDVFGGTRGRVTVRIAVSARDTDKLVLAGRVGAERALLFGLWLRRDARSPAA